MQLTLFQKVIIQTLKYFLVSKNCAINLLI